MDENVAPARAGNEGRVGLGELGHGLGLVRVGDGHASLGHLHLEGGEEHPAAEPDSRVAAGSNGLVVRGRQVGVQILDGVLHAADLCGHLVTGAASRHEERRGCQQHPEGCTQGSSMQTVPAHGAGTLAAVASGAATICASSAPSWSMTGPSLASSGTCSSPTVSL